MSYGGDNVIPSIVAADQSLASSFQSSALQLHKTKAVTFVIKCTSVTDNVGTFGIEVANTNDEPTSADWVALTLSSVPTLADADVNLGIDLLEGIGAFNWLRLTFTAGGTIPDGVCNVDVKRVAQGR